MDGAAKFCTVSAASDLSVRAEFLEIPSLAGPLCPSGSLSANGLTQAQLDAGLISAAQANNLEDVCEHLRRGASVEAQEQSGAYRRTALMIAAHDGYLELAKLLHANGADVSSRVGNGGMGGRANPGRWRTHGDSGFTALMYAAGVAGRAEMVGWLLDNGADPNLGDSRGRVPLFEAAFYGRVDVMGLLLDGGADVDGTDVWGLAPLHAAGPHYNYGRGPEWSYAVTVAGYLLSRGADVNARDSWGRSPLDVYAEWSHPNAAAVLRNAGGKCFVQTGPLCGEVQVAVGFSSSGSGTVSAEGGGGALSDGDEVRQGATVVFTATPAAGHYVSGWSGNCAEVGEVADGLDGAAQFCAAAADSALSVRAEFSEIPSLAGPLCPSGSLSANGLAQAQLDAELISAARDNDLAGACEYLRRGANVDARESGRYYKRTALMIAANEGFLDLAKLLHANGADVNLHGGSHDGGQYSRGWSALHYAAVAGDAEFARWLLDSGAEVDTVWAGENTALWEASYWGRPEVVELLLSRGADVLRSPRDLSGIRAAVRETTVNYPYTRTMLSYYYPKPSADSLLLVVSLLAAGGAELNERRRGGRTILDEAVNRDSARVAGVLRQFGGKCFLETGPLCEAVQVAVGFSSSGSGTVSAAGDDDALSDGDDVRQGSTVMFTATPAAGHYVSGWSGNCADAGNVADGLDGTAKSCSVSADSDLSVRAEFSEIPSLAGPLCPSGSLTANGLTQAELNAGLVSAAQANNLEDVCEHLRRGASVESHEQSGTYRRTALMIAAYDRYLELAKLLHANGADVNSRVGNGGMGGRANPGRWRTHGDSGFTALMYAAGAAGAAGSAEAAGRAEMVGWLLDNGADPNLGDSRGRVPLFEAAFYGRVDVMGLLLDGGADVDGTDVWGLAPLHAAGPHYNYGSGPEWSYAATVAGYLLSRGADVNARDSWGRSPLDMYAEWSHPNAAAVLRNAGGKCFVRTGPLCGEVQMAVGFSSSGSGTVSAEGGGGALSDGDDVRQGATVVFMATPAAGHYVSGWSGNCAEVGEVADGLDGTAKSCAVSADSDLSVRAEFSEIPSLAGPLCPSGSLSANGLAQAQLDAELISAARDNDLAGACEYLRRGANVDARESGRYYKRTALMIAANEGFLDLAKLLHANGADVNLHGGSHDGGQYSRGWSALHYAAVAGDAEFARWLLDSGAEVDTVWAGENTALWEASYWGRPEVVELLLSRGADVLRSPRDLSGIRAAVRETTVNYPYTRTMLSYYYPKPSADSLLLVVSLLAAGGAELNERRRGGRTILDEAVNRDNARVAKVLRQFGGKCFLETGPLCGAVQVAVGFSSSGSGTVSAEGDDDALSDGDEVRQGATVMFTATPAAGHYVSGWSGNCADAGEVADGLDGAAKFCTVSAASDLSVRAEFLEIPSLAGPLCPSGSLSANGLTQAQLDAGLISAAQANNLEDVCEHLRRGASVEAQEQSGAYRRTALMIAAHDGYLELAKLLHANGADVNSRVGNGGMGGRANPGRWRTHGDSGFTALMYAAGVAGRAEMVGWLLDNGADPNLGDSRGRVPLFEAAFYGRVDVMGLLLDGGADVDGTDVWGLAPLHAAGPHYNYGRGPEWSYAVTVAGYLLSRGADVNARDSWGRSPLDMYAEWSHPNAAAVLRNAGGKCFVQTGPLCGVDVAVDFSSSGSGTVSAEGDGGALSDGDDVRQGATVVFMATPAAGHYVSGWLGNCADAGGVADGLDGTAKSCSVSADSDLSVRAEFSEIPSLAGPLCPSGSLSASGLTTAELNMTLRLAARGGDAARACEALRRGADVNDNLDNTEFTPLQEAVSGGYLEATELLLANGAEVNKRKDGAGRSPLDLAARDNEAEIAALLRDADGECFLETGPLCGSVPVATPDLVTVVNTVAGTVAATVANTIVATVAAGSCPAGTLPTNGMTQAQLDYEFLGAALENDLEGVCEYLRRGANIEIRTDQVGRPHHRSEDPSTALMIAGRDNYLDLAGLLLSNRADVDSTGGLAGGGWSALHIAAYEDHADVARVLLDGGADPDVDVGFEHFSSWKPLHEAAYYNNWRIMKVLLTSGANPNIQTTRSGRNGTPLHYVFDGTRNSPALAVSVLVAGGAEVNLQDSGGNSALDLAARGGDAASAEILRAAGGQCFVSTSSLCGSAPAPAAESVPATDRLRERFSGAFNPSPAFGDAFGAVSGSSERFLGRLDSLMRSSAGADGNAWDSFGGWQRENEHGRMWFSTGQRGDFGFGAGGNGAGGDLSASPFAALVGNGMLAGGETGLGADGKLRIAAFADYQARSLLDGEDKQWTQWAARGTAIETAMTEAERFSGLAENQTRGAMTELHLGGGDLGVALQAGAVSESDSVLSGTAGDESLRGLRSRTAFAGLSGAADLFGSGWRLRGSAHLGRSWAESEGMLLDSDLWASAFSAGLERGGWLYSDDGFVLRFSQPLRVESWEMELVGDSGAGRLGADPSGRQLDVDAAYRLPLSGGGWLLLSAGVRRDGGHSSSSDLEAGALFSVERGF